MAAATESAPTVRLLLASTSVYRRELLARLRLPFDCVAPAVDESAAAGEAAAALAQRLAADKCAAVAARHPDAVVLGSDQVACIDGTPLGKPGGHAAAFAQLRRSSGRAVEFLTAIHVVAPGMPARAHLDRTTVRFRALGDAEIERYLQAERPFDCAGSFKCEGLGIALFEAIDSSDPTALVGLPLIATAGLLREAGFALP